MVEQGVQPEQIAAPAKAANLPHTHRCDDRGVAELLAGVDVAQVDFDGGQLHGGDGVAQCVGVMGERARVDDDPARPRARVVDEIDQRTFVVALKGAHLMRRGGRRGVDDLAEAAPGSRFHRAEKGEFNSQDRRRQFAVILGLFKIMYHVSKRINLADWYMVSEKRLWYLLKRYHILFHPVGPEMEYHGVRIPYIGHISEIENHMLKVNQSLAESFIEGLDQSADEGKATCPVPPPEVKPREVFETVPDIVWPYRIPQSPPVVPTATDLGLDLSS